MNRGYEEAYSLLSSFAGEENEDTIDRYGIRYPRKEKDPR